MFACWFQPGLISQPTVFSSHNKPVPAGLISPETNQRTGLDLLNDLMVTYKALSHMIISEFLFVSFGK